MEIYKKVEYIHKDKKKYIGYSRKAVYYGFFKEMPLDKLKADKLQRNRSRQRRRVENKDQVEMLCHLRDTNSLLLSCHLEIGPKPVDDTFTLNFAEWLRKESYDVGDKWIPARQ
jgi:hypothetical protein